MTLQSIKGRHTIRHWLGYSQVSPCCFVMKGVITFQNKRAIARVFDNGTVSKRTQTNWRKRYVRALQTPI